ncbi:MAG: FeoB-associated Cys-rich membrane protein [Erysipelotrichaceae bacterium]|nr:FeoB-associated Cys-rich membrane protein [Erysipelotrichaceae bacterium]
MNIWDIILTVLLTAAVLLAVRKIRNDRKAGRVSCGGNCSACSQICSWSATREFVKK